MNLNFKEKFAEILVEQTGLTKDQILDMIEVPPNFELGDFAFPCFLLSKQLKKSPINIALEISSKLNSNFFEKINAVGPYVNVFVDKKKFMKNIFESSDNFTKKDENILIEYMNANPNKPLHIGQARNVCIGDSMIRIFEHLGYVAHGVNYGDDSGVNVGYNIVGHMYYGLPLESDKKFDHYCGDIYVKMRAKDDDPEFKQKLSDTLLQIEHGTDSNINQLHFDYTRKCTIAQFQSCWRMNAFFDLINWETDILHLKFFDHVIDKLKNSGHLKYAESGDAKGCRIIDLSSLPEFAEEEKQYQILIKSDGVATYVAKDIVYAMWKLGYLGKDFYYKKFAEQPNGYAIVSTSSNPKDLQNPGFKDYNTVISVIDNRQSLAQKVVSGALKILGYINEQKQYLHLGYGVVWLTPATLTKFGFEISEEEKKEAKLPFSSRKGWFVTIDETLDMLKKTVYQSTKQRNSDKSEEWLDDTAEKIAVGAFRFALIKTDLNKDIVFDIDEVLDMEGETGAYVLYTYARINSILTQSGINYFDFQKVDIEKLNEEQEFQIIKKISEFDDVIESSQKNLAPYLIARYLIELCRMFNSYYTKVTVLKASEDIKISRLMLLKKLQDTIRISMNLIGMKEIDRM